MAKREISRKVEQLSERSDMVQEILGRTPNWMIRWGTTVIFLILFLLFVGAAVFSYNDVIPARVVITSKNPPIYLKARKTGRIEKLFVTPSQEVTKGMVLAEIENDVEFEHLIQLKESLLRDKCDVTSLTQLEVLFPSELELGELQTIYANFLSAYQRLILFNELKPNALESLQIQKQLQEQELFLQKQLSQLELMKKDLELSKSSFKRGEALFKKGVISKAEFETINREYLSDRQQYESFLSAIATTRIGIANFNSLQTKNSIDGVESSSDNLQAFKNAKQNLTVSIDRWQRQNLLMSPIEGMVTVFDLWNQYQEVAINETLFTIVPIETDGIIGRVTLPVLNSGKVKNGQKVLIKLDNYPFEEWGGLIGTVKSISEVPKKGEQSFYTVFISVNSLETTYKKRLEFKQEMEGRAEIIVEELSVFERIFYEIRSVFYK